MRLAAKRRNDFEQVEVGQMIMIFGDQFATESAGSENCNHDGEDPLL